MMLTNSVCRRFNNLISQVTQAQCSYGKTNPAEADETLAKHHLKGLSGLSVNAFC